MFSFRQHVLGTLKLQKETLSYSQDYKSYIRLFYVSSLVHPPPLRGFFLISKLFWVVSVSSVWDGISFSNKTLHTKFQNEKHSGRTYPSFSSSTGSLGRSVWSRGLFLGRMSVGADAARVSMNTPFTYKTSVWGLYLQHDHEN